MKEKPGATTVVFPGKYRNNKKKLKFAIQFSQAELM